MVKYYRREDERLFSEFQNDVYLLDYLILEPIKIVIDIGANIGVSVSYLVGKLPNLERIIAFEPDEENYSLLFQNVEDIKMHYHNVDIQLFNYGVFYGRTLAGVLGAGDNNPSGYIVDAIDDTLKKDSWKAYEGKLFRLTTLEKQLGDNFVPDLVKMDCELSEFNIISHSPVVQRARFIACEFHHVDNKDILDFITAHIPKHKIIAVSQYTWLLGMEKEH